MGKIAQKLRVQGPVTAVPEPLPGHRCPRCEAKLFRTWYQEERCYMCGYEPPTPPPAIPTLEELRALPGLTCRDSNI